MTIDDIKAMNKVVITPDEAARVIGCSAQYIRVAARQCPEQLKFPIFFIGRRVKIPRVPFINYLEKGERFGDETT